MHVKIEMKKSQLRKIIKESIKELMTEQSFGQTNAAPGCYVTVDTTTPNFTSYGGSPCTISCITYFSQACCQNTNNQPYTPTNNSSWWSGIGYISGSPCDPNCISGASNGWGGWTMTSGGIENLLINHTTNIPSNGQMWGHLNTSSPPPSLPIIMTVWTGSWTSSCNDYINSLPSPSPLATSAGSCNPAAWSNHANWTSTFTNTVANHNNPCNFLNKKIAQFTSNLQGTGQGNYQNMQNCKLDLANDLHTQNNC